MVDKTEKEILRPERIEPRQIPEPQYVPPEVDIKTTPLTPPTQQKETTAYNKAKYKTFKEHLQAIRRKTKKSKKKKK